MALIKCSECGKEISDKAASCPKCGCPVSKKTRKVIVNRKDITALKVFITLDGNNIGNIKAGGSMSFDVPVGQHVFNVNTVGMHGNGNSVYGAQLDVTEDAHDIIIDIGFKYSMMTEISGQTQDVRILSIDYGNNHIETFEQSNRNFNFNTIVFIVIGVTVVLNIIIGILSGNHSLILYSILYGVIAFAAYNIFGKKR